MRIPRSYKVGFHLHRISQSAAAILKDEPDSRLIACRRAAIRATIVGSNCQKRNPCRDAERVDAVNKIGSSRRPRLNHDDVFQQVTALWGTKRYLGSWFNSPLAHPAVVCEQSELVDLPGTTS